MMERRLEDYMRNQQYRESMEHKRKSQLAEALRQRKLVKARREQERLRSTSAVVLQRIFRGYRARVRVFYTRKQLERALKKSRQIQSEQVRLTPFTISYTYACVSNLVLGS